MPNAYPLLRPLLFQLSPETAHRLAFAGLNLAAKTHLAGLALPAVPDDPVTVMGLRFPNRIGLAAGLDKNAEYLPGLAQFGFGHIEVGTVTPRAQPGNPQPRCFRLVADRALINRMGFNNEGLAAVSHNIERSGFKGVLGINLGKNFDTPNHRAAEDYLAGLEACYPLASYLAVNISSPNTKHLRELQQEDALDDLVSRLKTEQTRLADRHGRYVPLVVKLAPDLETEALTRIARLLARHKVDGIIATNTTVGRAGLTSPRAQEAGGLSGAPLRDHATQVVRLLAKTLDGELPIIATGGVLSGADAREKIEAGAALVQLYTGLIYAGPHLVRDCVQATLGFDATERGQNQPVLSTI